MTDKERKIRDNAAYWKQVHDRFVGRHRARIWAYDTDVNQEERKNQQLCRYCFYMLAFFVVGDTTASSFCHTTTSSFCQNCYKELVNADTDTDDYCMECAIKYNVCVRCGAEMD